MREILSSVFSCLLAMLCLASSTSAQEQDERVKPAAQAKLNALGEQALKDARKLRSHQLDPNKLRATVADLAGGVSRKDDDARADKSIAALRSPLTGEKVQAAARLLAARGPSSEVLLALVECLGDGDPRVRIEAATRLVEQEELSPGSIAAIALALEDHDRDVRGLIVRRIGDRGEAAKSLVVPLEQLLIYELSVGTYGDPLTVARALAAIDPNVELWREGLGEALLGGPSSSVNAVRDLFFPPGEQKKIPTSALVALLGDERTKVRAAGLYLVEELGEADMTVLPHVVRLLEDKSPRVRLAAVRVLFRVNPESSKIASQLNPLLADPNPYVRMLAATLIWHGEKDSTAVVPALASALNKSRNRSRR